MTHSWTPWHDVVEVRDDLKTNQLTLDLFAADLYDVIMQRGERKVYEDPREFFKLTYPTHNLRQLTREVADRLAGESTKAIRQLELTYGGGKTHSLVALYHLFRDPASLPDLPAVEEFRSHIDRDIPRAQIAAISFDYFDTRNGIAVDSPDGETRTLVHPWSALAYQLAGEEGLRLLSGDAGEERADPPATNTLIDVLTVPVERDDASVLLLLDEVLMYVQNEVGRDRMREKPLINFFQCLTQAVTKVDRCCLIASILASDLTTYDELGKRLEMDVAKIFGRNQDEAVRPVEKQDIAEVLRRRFFTLESIREKDAFRPHVTAALQGVQALDEDTRKKGQEAEDRYLNSYPFHPELTTIFYEKWTNLESFQEARGVLRVMALAVRDAATWDESPLISANVFLSAPGRDELCPAASELADIAAKAEYEGPRENWANILEGELGRAREIQNRYAGLNGREVEQVIFSIFLHSQPKGHTAKLTDLMRLVGHTRPDTIELEQALKNLTATSWFLDEKHFPESRDEVAREWRMGSSPNLTQMHAKARTRVEDLVESELVERIRKTRSLVEGARGAGAVPHKLPKSPFDVKDNGDFHYAVLGPDAASQPGDPSEYAKAFLFDTTRFSDNNGAKPRVNKNAVVLAVPSTDGLEAARTSMRDYLGWEEVKSMLRDEDVSDSRDRRLRRNLKRAEERIEEAIRQAYVIAVTVDADGDAVAFKVPAGETSLFAQIKNHDRSRIQDSAIAPEAILPGGPYDLWREGEATRPVSHIAGAFSEQPKLPKMLNPDGVYDTIALGCEKGTFVLRQSRPDASAKTLWRRRPEPQTLREEGLEAVLPEHADLTTLDPELLRPGALPELWTEGEPLAVEALHAYFDGETTVKDDFGDPVPVPRASADVLHAAVRSAVEQGYLWLRSGQASLFREAVPDGLLDAETTLYRPPASLSMNDLLPKSVPDAWDDGATTADALLKAVSEQRGAPVPWVLVRDALSDAFRSSYLKRAVDSTDWPTDRSGAAQVTVEVPDEEPDAKPQRWNEPSSDYGNGPPSTAADLEIDEVQNLADEVAELQKAAAAYGIRFHLRIDVGTHDPEVPDDVKTRLNEALKRVSEKLGLQ